MQLISRTIKRWNRNGAEGMIRVKGRGSYVHYQVKWAIDPSVGWEQWGAPNEVLSETLPLIEELWRSWVKDFRGF